MGFEFISKHDEHGVLLKLSKDNEREAKLRKYLDTNSRNNIDRKEATLRLYERLELYETYFRQEHLGDRLTLGTDIKDVRPVAAAKDERVDNNGEKSQSALEKQDLNDTDELGVDSFEGM